MIFKTKKLENGLRIITAPIKETKAVAVLFLVGVGSRYEEKNENGLSHFLEHMFFKGTYKRPTTQDISHELDSVGASYNAFTSEEETGFHIKVSSDHFNLALDMLSDMIFNSKFDPDEVEREKGVILEEINMYQDIPQRYVFDLTKELLYGDSALGRSTAGVKETVSKFIREDFVHYKEKFYNPSNIVIAVAGNPGKLNWTKEIEKMLKGYPVKKNFGFEKTRILQKKPKIMLHYKKTDQAHLTLGFPTFSRTDRRRPILKVLNNILGETMSSRLFTQVRERRGLAYYIGTDYWDFRDNGAIMAYAGIDLKRVEAAISVILDEFKKIKLDSIKKSELDKAKENIKGRTYLELEDSMSIASFLADQEVFWDKISYPDKLINEIFKVTEKDVTNLAKEIFVPEKLNFTMISPFKDKAKFGTILNKFK